MNIPKLTIDDAIQVALKNLPDDVEIDITLASDAWTVGVGNINCGYNFAYSNDDMGMADAILLGIRKAKTEFNS